jgi:hypothetical protein
MSAAASLALLSAVIIALALLSFTLLALGV